MFVYFFKLIHSLVNLLNINGHVLQWSYSNLISLQHLPTKDHDALRVEKKFSTMASVSAICILVNSACMLVNIDSFVSTCFVYIFDWHSQYFACQKIIITMFIVYQFSIKLQMVFA